MSRDAALDEATRTLERARAKGRRGPDLAVAHALAALARAVRRIGASDTALAALNGRVDALAVRVEETRAKVNELVDYVAATDDPDVPPDPPGRLP